MGNIFVWYESLDEWVLHGDLFELLADYTLLTNGIEVTEAVNPLGRKVPVRINDDKNIRLKTRFQAGEIIYTKIDHDGNFRRNRFFCFSPVFSFCFLILHSNPCNSEDPVESKFDGRTYIDIINQLEKDVIFEVVEQDSHQQRVCAQTLQYVLPIRRTCPVLTRNSSFIISGASSVKIPNSELNFSQGSEKHSFK